MDSNGANPTIAYTPTGSSSMKRRKTKASISKGFSFVNLNLSSPIDLDLWDNVSEEYLGTESEVNSNSQSFIGDSALDQTRRIPFGELPISVYSASTPAQARIQRQLRVPLRSKQSQNRNSNMRFVAPKEEPRPPKFLWREAVHRTGVISSRDNIRIGLRRGTTYHILSSNRCQISITIEPPSAFLTPLEEIQTRPTLVAEMTQGSLSTTSSLNPKIAV